MQKSYDHLDTSEGLPSFFATIVISVSCWSMQAAMDELHAHNIMHGKWLRSMRWLAGVGPTLVTRDRATSKSQSWDA